MLNKLAISGIKHRIRDYSVLFSGLTISAAIFYMFMTLATNKEFLNSNTMVNFAPIVFGFGIVLLSIITLVYIIYANSFLMSMRQREYGMFMMLGARGSKIGRMIFTETLIIGTIATAVGTVIGIGLTGVLSKWLIKMMDIQITHFNPFYLNAVLSTVLFFIVIFDLAAMKNSITLRKTNVLKLLNSDKQPTRIKKVGWWKLIQAIMGIALLTVGYVAMFHMFEVFYLYVPMALFTIVLGTYLVINSLFSWIIKVLKSNRSFSMKKLNNFTLSQMGFRISEYTRILSMVAMLFAMALGAITVGAEFKGAVIKMTDTNNYYDVAVHNIDAQQRKNVSKIDVKTKAKYDYKKVKDGKQIIMNVDQFKKNKLVVNEYIPHKNENVTTPTRKSYNFSTKSQQDEHFLGSELWMAMGADNIAAFKFVNSDEFNKIAGKTESVTMIKSKDFYSNLPAIKKVTEQDKKNYQANGMNQTKYDIYTTSNMFFSGLEFMGLFLGIAFLAMLASCLMFKILSGAASDVKRYEMLRKMGVRKNLLASSINKEIAVLFLIPGVLGMIHVMFGLQMFSPILTNPYTGIAIPFAAFLILYFGYYLVTILLYKKIVLKK